MPEFTERWHVRLRGAQRDLVDACSGIERVAELTSMSKSQVGRWRSPTDRDLMPLSAVLMLEDDCGRPFVTAIMAEFHGRSLTDSEQRGQRVANLAAQVADLCEQSSHMVVETVRAKADGIVTPAEATALRAINSRVKKLNSEIEDLLAGVVAEGPLRVVEGGGE